MAKSQISVRIPPPIMEELNSYVDKTGTTKTEVIVGALTQYLGCSQDLSIPKRMAEVERKLSLLEVEVRSKI